jgi:hypothetical protein
VFITSDGRKKKRGLSDLDIQETASQPEKKDILIFSMMSN